MVENDLIKIDEIKNRIFTIRGMQVILDRDIAEFFGVETKVLNQAVKRNPERFPLNFCFQLDKKELNNWKSQFVTSNQIKMGLRKRPFAFSEQGVAMLSAVLKSKTAIKISIQIMEAFVYMRHYMTSNSLIFQRLDIIDAWRIETNTKIGKILNVIDSNQLPPKQGVLFDGQTFEAHKFVSDIVRSAEKSIILIDNYVDDTVLTLFSKRKQGVTLKILTKNLSKQFILDMQKFNEQFPPAEIKEFNFSHDRFMIIDDRDLYLFGASLKDLGKKWFGFARMDIGAAEILTKLGDSK
jgi:hypothetical protein